MDIIDTLNETIEDMKNKETSKKTIFDKSEVEETIVSALPVEEVSEDRSAYNCPTCKGEGLVPSGTRLVLCSECIGRGKV